MELLYFAEIPRRKAIRRRADAVYIGHKDDFADNLPRKMRSGGLSINRRKHIAINLLRTRTVTRGQRREIAAQHRRHFVLAMLDAPVHERHVCQCGFGGNEEAINIIIPFDVALCCRACSSGETLAGTPVPLEIFASAAAALCRKADCYLSS